MRKIFVVLATISMTFLMTFSASLAIAADEQTELPTQFTYAKEWLNLNLFTWKTESKISLVNRYATNRAEEIKSVATENKSDALAGLVTRYSRLIAKENQILQKNKANFPAFANVVKSGTLSQQNVLSEARQSATIEADQKTIAAAQESAVNTIKQNIADLENPESAADFSNQVVAVWRDPNKIIKNDETTTRVYAAGTSLETSDTNNGVVIDGGQAKITNENNNLKIEYAPGTGPNSVVGEDGKKVWKIQMSDGSIVESYTAGSNVVIGKSSGTASNIVVNTVSGGTSGTANVVVGSGGASGVTVVGGKAEIKTGQASMESDSPASDPLQTSTNSLNSINSGNSLNQTSGNGQGVEQVSPVDPQ